MFQNHNMQEIIEGTFTCTMYFEVFLSCEQREEEKYVHSMLPIPQNTERKYLLGEKFRDSPHDAISPMPDSRSN